MKDLILPAVGPQEMHINERWFESALNEIGMKKLLKGESGYALPSVHWDTPTEPAWVFTAMTRMHEQHLRQLKRWAGRTANEGCWGSARSLFNVIENAARRAGLAETPTCHRS